MTVLGWAWWRRQPRSELKVSAESITWGSPTKEVTRLEPGETGLLKFRQNAAQQTGWFLARADDTHEAAISMFGFDIDDFPRLVQLIASADPSQFSSGAVRTLFAIRWKVGGLLGWDGPDAGLGCPCLR